MNLMFNNFPLTGIGGEFELKGVILIINKDISINTLINGATNGNGWYYVGNKVAFSSYDSRLYKGWLYIKDTLIYGIITYQDILDNTSVNGVPYIKQQEHIYTGSSYTTLISWIPCYDN